MKGRLSPRVAYSLLTLMMLAYLLFQGSVALQLHYGFVTSADDLSNIDQVVWNSQNGRILERTTGTRSVPRYGEHLEPIWIAFGLIYLFWDKVDALLLAQTIALAAGALPVFWLARDAWGVSKAKIGRKWERGGGRFSRAITFLDDTAGLVFAAIYLLSPFVGRANSAEVHAMPFAVAPMLLALFWGWKGRWGRVAPLVLYLLLVREDAGLLVIAFGLWTLIARRVWKAGVALMVSGGAAVAITLFGIIAHFADQRFSGRERSIFFERYEIFGEGVVDMLWGMLTRADLWVELITDPWRWAFLQDFVISTGGLVLLAPTAWLLFAPHFLLNFLSDYFAQYGHLQHYGAPLVPGLMVATILGGAQALRWGGRHPVWRLFLLLLALTGAWWSARTAEWQPLAQSWIQPPVTAHHRLLADIAASIPPRAPLSSDSQLHPHLAHRRDAYRFPKMGENTQWVLVDVTTNRTTHPADLQQKLQTLLADDWGIANAQDGYLLLQRGLTTKTIPDRFYSFAHPTSPPEVALHARFGEQLEVLGYDIKQDFWGRVTLSWHLRPLAPLAPSLKLDAALLDRDGNPLPETAHQPLTLLFWQPLTRWKVGEKYLIQTLPRASEKAFWPALTLREEEEQLPIVGCTTQDLTCEGNRSSSPVRLTQSGQWLTGGEWQIEEGHIQRGQIGWRQWEAPTALAAQPGEWAVARLGAWHVASGRTKIPPCSSDGAQSGYIFGACSSYGDATEKEQEIHITLHWQATQNSAPPTQARRAHQARRAFSRFLHIVPAEGAPVPFAQNDGPLGSDYPITQWLAGEWVSETITITLPADAPSQWRLLVGLYDPNSGERLPVAPDGGNATFELK